MARAPGLPVPLRSRRSIIGYTLPFCGYDVVKSDFRWLRCGQSTTASARLSMLTDAEIDNHGTNVPSEKNPNGLREPPLQPETHQLTRTYLAS